MAVIHPHPYEIANKIRHYDCARDGCDYIGAILSAEALEEVCATLNELLQSEAKDTIADTCFLLRDAIFCHSHSNCAVFVENFETSSVVKTLDSLLLTSPSYYICHQVIDALGKNKGRLLKRPYREKISDEVFL